MFVSGEELEILLKHEIGDAGAQIGLAGSHGPDRVGQLIESGVFEQVSGSPSSQHSGHEEHVRVHGQRKDLDLWIGLRDLSGGFDAVQVRHGHIHDDHVRFISAASRTASRPFLAWARISTSGLDDIMATKPSRTIRWSSAMMILIFMHPSARNAYRLSCMCLCP